MPDLVLKKLTLRNWMTCRNVELEFPSHGLIWVTGQNTASGGKLESVGSGKTSIGEAICRALTGVYGRFSNIIDYSTHREGDMYVNLECDVKGAPLVIESGYRCAELSRTGEGLRFTFSGRKIERGRFQQTREELTKTIRVTPNLVKWAVYIDGDKLKFNGLPEKEAVELVMSALSQPPWTQWHDAAKRTASNFEQGLNTADTEHKGATKTRQFAQTNLDTADC
jgi:hypothetical protein